MGANLRTLRLSVLASGVAVGLAAMPVATAFADSQPTSQTQTRIQGQSQEQQDNGDLAVQQEQDVQSVQNGTWGAAQTVTLGNGATATVQNRGGMFVAIIKVNGKEIATLSSTHPTLTDGGYVYELNADNGRIGLIKLQDKEPALLGGWVSQGIVQLGRGWSAKVDVNPSARSAKAELYLQKALRGSLHTYVRNASIKLDGITFALTSDGRVTRSGMDGGGQGAKRVFVRWYKNLGGSASDAKVYKVKNGFDAEMWAKDRATGRYVKWGTIQQRGNKAAYSRHNGALFVLTSGGSMKGWKVRVAPHVGVVTNIGFPA
ncbi:hypothetical protein [Streptomyces formicae]|uniref:Lipoprotein n=1 Tax=Streptomyces formicae TaxID=1616117 RepID=A0ABY3WNF4_9ACTN|nr:hypothetical protein [Streptomyces formicae]UNM12999.1 hypothetical protein J4032_17075 [Streptomyces formicae]